MNNKPIRPKLKMKPEWDMFVQICIHGTNDLRRFLKITENHGEITIKSNNLFRDLYVYQVLDELEKAGCCLIKSIEYLGDYPSQQLKAMENRKTRNVVTANIDEQNMWLRKLLEILVETVCFKQSNLNIYYRHYMLLKRLDRLNKLQNNYKDFYGINSNILKYKINKIKDEIGNLMKKINPSTAWYVVVNKKGEIGFKFTSFRNRLLNNYNLFTKNELINIGLTPEFYSRYCEHIHPSISNIKHVDMNDIERNINHIGLLARNILLSTKRLLNVRAKKNSLLSQESRIERINKYPNKLYKKISKTSIEKGDFVIVLNKLGEVLKINKNKYHSIEVSFINEPLYGSIYVDTFPPNIVRLFEKGRKLRKEVLANLKKKTPNIRISAKVLQDSCRKSILTVWSYKNIRNKILGIKQPDGH